MTLRRPRPGSKYTGPAAYIDGNGDGDPKHGYYALTTDGRDVAHPLVRLVAVAHEDGSHHYEIARKGEPHQRPYPGAVPPPPREVELEFVGEGEAVVASEPAPGPCASPVAAGGTLVRCALTEGHAGPHIGANGETNP